MALQSHFAGKIVTTYKDNVPETAQVTQVIDSFIQQGYKLIVSTEYGYIPYVTTAAKANPDVKFLQVQGSQTLPNLSVFNGDSSQAYYLAGMALAAASKTNTIGWLGGFAIPALIGNIDATELGAQAINPHAQVRAVYINTWEDPAKEEQASLALLSAGAGALTHDESDPTSGQVAQAHGIPWAGSQADQSQFAPTETVTSTLFNWEPYLATQVSAILAGTWHPSAYFGGATNGTVGIPSLTPLAQKLIGSADTSKIKAKAAALQAGTFHVFSGPLTSNKGKQMVAANHTLSSSQIQSINWYVKGVQASGATS
jgi:basic membrane lipoprotein Med (substrate-binding protein (PBP1-ABC) superfamily)